MKSTAVILAATVILAAASVQAQRGIALNGAGLIPVESKIVKGQPYSAEIASESVQTLADGNRIVQKTTGRVYRDGEGRVRREEDRGSRTPSITISDAVAGQSYSLNAEQRIAQVTPRLPLRFNVTQGPAGDLAALSVVVGELKLAERLVEQKKLEAASSAAVSPQGVGGRGAPAVEGGRGRGGNTSEETTEERLQDRLTGGVLASGTRRTTIIAAGAIGNVQPIKIVSEEWYSPDLQILVQTEHTDPRFGRSTYQVLNIGRNEPDPSLFQVPSDYTIRGKGVGQRGGRQ
jgi:hypothetical protein